MSRILEIATNVSTPLMVAGFLAGAFFLILRQILRKDLFPALTRQLSVDIIKLIIERLFTLALVALVLGFAGFVLTVFVKGSEASHAKGGNDQANLWEKNWHTVNESHGFLGSSGPVEEGGGSWTNREEFLAMLGALDLSPVPELVGKREQLITLILTTESHPKGDPYYNLRYTPEIRQLEDELKRRIRDRAIDSGVDVRAAPR